MASAEGDRDAEKALGESDVDHGDDEGVNLGRPRNEDNNGLCLHFWKEGRGEVKNVKTTTTQREKLTLALDESHAWC